MCHICSILAYPFNPRPPKNVPIHDMVPLHAPNAFSWAGETSDLDLVLYGLWEGSQQGFGQSQAPGPSTERLVSSAGFDGGTALWLWVIAYDGEPTDYQVDLVLR